jgi:hypothetical protein
MANHITNMAHPHLSTLGMSNGLSDLFFGAMLVSSSAFAQTAWQNGLALWFAEHDAGPWKGYGTLGFDVAEMPWQQTAFTRQHPYVLAVIADALSGNRWESLSMTSIGAQHLADALAHFKHLVKRLKVPDLADNIYWPMKPLDQVEQVEQVERCPIHQVVLHEFTYSVPNRPWGDRCLICNHF